MQVWLASSLDFIFLPEECRRVCAARGRAGWGAHSTCPRAWPPPSWCTWRSAPGLRWWRSPRRCSLSRETLQWSQSGRCHCVLLPGFVRLNGYVATESSEGTQSDCSTDGSSASLHSSDGLDKRVCRQNLIRVRILTVAVRGVWGRGLAGQHLAAAEQLVLYHRPLLVHDASQNPSVVLKKISLTFSFCVRSEERFLTGDFRFPDYQSGVVWVRCAREVRVQLIIIENRFCGERRCEIVRVMWWHRACQRLWYPRSPAASWWRSRPRRQGPAPGARPPAWRPSHWAPWGWPAASSSPPPCSPGEIWTRILVK